MARDDVEIQDKKIGRSYYRWTECPICRNSRWVRIERGEPRSRTCRKCCSPETRRKMSMSRMGHPTSQSTRDKIRLGKLGHPYWGPQQHTKETRQLLSTIKTGTHLSAETRQKLSYINTGRKHEPQSESAKEAIRQARLGSKASPETKEKLRLSHLGKKPSEKAVQLATDRLNAMWRNSEYRNRILTTLHSPENKDKAIQAIIKSRTGVPRSKSTRDKISASLMGHPFSEATRKKWMISMQKALHMQPNQSEQRLYALLDELYPDQWAFVGDWSMVIAGKNPDFVNVNGRKLIIELFGDYWHKGQNPQDRINTFAVFGFHTLVIWESELKDFPTLTKRIQEFVVNA